MIIRRLLLWRALSKGLKVELRNVYLAAFEYFRPGIMRFSRPIRIKHFTPCTRVVDRQPWARGWYIEILCATVRRVTRAEVDY